jgi:hypothetical protein
MGSRHGTIALVAASGGQDPRADKLPLTAYALQRHDISGINTSCGWYQRSSFERCRPMLLKKSFSTADQNFRRQLMRFSDNYVTDLVS